MKTVLDDTAYFHVSGEYDISVPFTKPRTCIFRYPYDYDGYALYESSDDELFTLPNDGINPILDPNRYLVTGKVFGIGRVLPAVNLTAYVDKTAVAYGDTLTISLLALDQENAAVADAVVTILEDETDFSFTPSVTTQTQGDGTSVFEITISGIATGSTLQVNEWGTITLAVQSTSHFDLPVNYTPVSVSGNQSDGYQYEFRTELKVYYYG